MGEEREGGKDCQEEPAHFHIELFFLSLSRLSILPESSLEKDFCLGAMRTDGTRGGAAEAKRTELLDTQLLLLLLLLLHPFLATAATDAEDGADKEGTVRVFLLYRGNNPTGHFPEQVLVYIHVFTN